MPEKYEDSRRVIYGFMPIFGPIYLLERYLSHRFNNRKEIKEIKDKEREERRQKTYEKFPEIGRCLEDFQNSANDFNKSAKESQAS